MPEKFLITMDQLKDFVTTKDPINRTKIMADVMTTPYREKSAWEVIFESLEKFVDSFGEDEKKKKTGKAPREKL